MTEPLSPLAIDKTTKVDDCLRTVQEEAFSSYICWNMSHHNQIVVDLLQRGPRQGGVDLGIAWCFFTVHSSKTRQATHVIEENHDCIYLVLINRHEMSSCVQSFVLYQVRRANFPDD